jgi:hypothetical protein
MLSLLNGQAINIDAIRQRVISCPAGQQALDLPIDFKTPGDLECAINIDMFSFAMPVHREDPHLIARAQKTFFNSN